MTVSLTLICTAGVLCAVGGVLMLTRALTRIMLGTVVAGNGINLFVIAASGAAGEPPLLGRGVDPARVADPLPQAIALTAVVITLGTTAFQLAMAYRYWELTGTDEVRDDVEDRRVALRMEALDARATADGRGVGRGPGDRRDERRALRSRLREDRAFQARGRDASGDLWDDILGADRPDPAEADR